MVGEKHIDHRFVEVRLVPTFGYVIPAGVARTNLEVFILVTTPSVVKRTSKKEPQTVNSNSFINLRELEFFFEASLNSGLRWEFFFKLNKLKKK